MPGEIKVGSRVVLMHGGRKIQAMVTSFNNDLANVRFDGETMDRVARRNELTLAKEKPDGKR